MTSTHHMNGGSKGALYRETRQATGSYVVRIVIATAEFAPMPPHWPGYPGGLILTAIRMRFSRHGGIYLVRCGMKTKPQAGSRAASRRSAPNPGSRACREDRAPSHRPQMSSGRLFLDRGARQQSPSPLHRQLHPKTVPGWGTMKWQRTVNSVLTICLSKRGKRNHSSRACSDKTLMPGRGKGCEVGGETTNREPNSFRASRTDGGSVIGTGLES